MTAQLDAICRRQSARFLDHCKATGIYSDELAGAYKRSMRYLFSDIKKTLHGTSYKEPFDETQKS